MRGNGVVLAVTSLLLCAVVSGSLAQINTGDLLDKMIDARGGREQLSDVRTSVMTGRMILVAQGGLAGEITITNAYPDKTRYEMKVAGALIVQAYDGAIAWTDNPMAGGFQELPAEELKSMKQQAIGDDVLLNPEKYGITYAYKGTVADSAVEYHVLEQSSGDGYAPIKYYVDPQTYLVYKTTTSKGNPAQPILEEVYYSDYRETNGLTQARQVSTFMNGQEAVRFLIDRIEYNMEIDPQVFRAAEKRFAKGELIADARQLADIIENVHPDPYEHIGGKIAYHRGLQHILQAIPEKGMTSSEFKALLCPFVAAIEDGHTEVYVSHHVNSDAPGGIPLRFETVEQSLYVSNVPGDVYRALIGAVLISVENVSIEELGKRLRRLKPLDNEYSLLWRLAIEYLWYAPYLQELLPEWKDSEHIRVQLRLASGETRDVVFDLPMATGSMYDAKSRITLPSSPESGMACDFLGSDKKTAYVRIDHMMYYRESFEARNSLGLESTPQEKLASIPSATEFFRSLAAEMKKAGTKNMIVDLRRNGGGDALMTDIMMYFLYGKEATLKTRWNDITLMSKTYLESRKNFSLEDINKGRRVPLREGDYNFSDDYSDTILGDISSLAKGFVHLPTFFSFWENGTDEALYCPERVIILTRPWTFSAGFGIAIRLYRMGAFLVGTPSGQAPNSGGNAIKWTLDNTGITGRVSQSYVVNFPNDPALSRVLPVHYPLTYRWLAAHDFDPDAEVLYALELLSKPEKLKK